MTLHAIYRLGLRTVNAWIDDRASSLGASLAYYTLFSMAPLLLIVVSVAGLVFGADAARGEVLEQLQGLMGPTGAAAVQSVLVSVHAPAGGVLGTAIGLVLTLVGATTVFAELQAALDRVWDVPPARDKGLWALLRARVLSFGLILGVGFLLMVSLMLSAMLAALQSWWRPLLGDWGLLIEGVNVAINFGLVVAIFAMIYKLMPRVSIAWSDVWVGAAVTALLFTVGRVAIGLYLGHSAVASGFGAAGSLVVVLVWVYYSAQIFLLGAEFTSVYARDVGSLRGQTPPAEDDDGAVAAGASPAVRSSAASYASSAEPSNGASSGASSHVVPAKRNSALRSS